MKSSCALSWGKTVETAMYYNECNPIFQRKSVRDFLQREVPWQCIENILKAAMQAPSAKNRRLWEFIVITDNELKAKISQISKYSWPAKNAAVVILTLANLSKSGANLNKSGMQSGEDWWIQDLSACSENILLQIVKEGLGGVWLGIYPDQERVRSVSQDFKLPDYIVPFSAIALGYAACETHCINQYDLSKVYKNYYGVAAINDDINKG